MNGRVFLLCSVVIALLLLATGCGSKAELSSISVTPTTATIQHAGGTAQFQATGTFSNGKTGSQNSQNLTTQVIWSSSSPAVATIDSGGLATAVAQGTTTITATGGNGGLSSTATVTVMSSTGGGGGGQGSLTSITVIPSNQTVVQPGETAQYIAIGSFTGTPPSQDLTNLVTWSSSDVRIATVNAGGLATGVGNCGTGQQTTITALSPPSYGGAVTGTATFQIGTCGTNNLPSLTVYDFGQGTGTVTSAPGGIDCGPTLPQSGCTGHFTLNSPVMLTATPTAGSLLGGFSANCTPVIPDPSSCPATSRESDVSSCTCSVNMTDNVTVGTIFNLYPY